MVGCLIRLVGSVFCLLAPARNSVWCFLGTVSFNLPSMPVRSKAHHSYFTDKELEAELLGNLSFGRGTGKGLRPLALGTLPPWMLQGEHA